MKRIISFFTALLCIIQCITVCADSQTDKYEYSPAREVFKALNMTTDEIDKLDGDDYISRGQYAYVLAEIMGYGNDGGTDGDSDIYGGAIAYLAELNVIAAENSKNFRPDDKLLFDDMIDPAIRALGYEQYAAALSKNISAGNLMAAKRIGILDGISDGGRYVSADTAFAFLKQAALASVLEYGYIYNNSVKYTNNDSSTLLYTYTGISYVDGIMTDNGITSLTGGTEHNDNITVNGVKMHCDKTYKYAHLIGMYTEAYYKNDTPKTLLYAAASDGDNKTVTVDAEQLDTDDGKFSAYNIVYTDGKRTQNIKLAPDADVIYNGAALTMYTASSVKIKQGSIRAATVDGNSKCSVLWINEYEDYVVNGTSEDTLYLRGRKMEKSDYGKLIVRIGSEVYDNFSFISPGSVVSVAVSHNNECAEVIASSNTVKGTVLSRGENDYGTDVYEIDGVQYKLSESMLDEIASKIPGAELPEIGAFYYAKLNYENKIVMITRLYEDMWQTAYCVGVSKDESARKGNVKAFLVMSDGKKLTPYFAEKVKVNGDKKIDADEMTDGSKKSYFFTSDGNPIRQPVHIKFNRDGNLSEIETPIECTSEYGYDKKVFSKDAHLDGGAYRGKNQRSIGVYTLSADALVIEDPNKSKPDSYSTDKISVKTAASVADGQMNNCDIYDLDEKFAADILVYEDSEVDLEESTTLFIIDKITNTLNGDDETVKKVYGYSSSSKVYISYTENKPGIISRNAKQGDICKIAATGSKLYALETILKLEDNPEPNVWGNSLVDSKWTNIFGYIYAADNTSITVVTPDSYTKTDKKIIGTSMNGGSQKVFIYDRKAKSVTLGTWQDISFVSIPDENGNINITAESPMVYIYRRYDRADGLVFVK